MLTVSVSTKFSLTEKWFGVMCFWTEEIGSSKEWRVVVAGTKVSPDTLPAVTHLSPLTYKLKIVWPHRKGQEKEGHQSEGTLTDRPPPEQHDTLRGEQVAHSGLQRNQPAADNSSNYVFLLLYPLRDGGANRKERCQPANLTACRSYDLVPFIKWNKTKIIFWSIFRTALAQLFCAWCVGTPR